VAEEIMREHQQQLAHAGRVGAVGEMASGLAHELAQPLSAILYFARGCAARLAAGQWGTTDAAPALQQIADQAERAGEFIRRLKAFVRRTPPQRASADINEIVRESLTFASAERAQGPAYIRTELAPDLPTVVVDRIQIEQVVLNLVRNGIEAVAGRPDAERVVCVRTGLAAGGEVCVRVWDAGRDITPEDAERMFDPFYTTKPAGTGLGLSISRSIIEAHQGRLWAEPDATGGKSLVFALPVSGEGNRDAE
jgi:C4-dicarboxylate-specific signal transduction histidine kinase